LPHIHKLRAPRFPDVRVHMRWTCRRTCRSVRLSLVGPARHLVGRKTILKAMAAWLPTIVLLPCLLITGASHAVRTRRIGWTTRVGIPNGGWTVCSSQIPAIQSEPNPGFSGPERRLSCLLISSELKERTARPKVRPPFREPPNCRSPIWACSHSAGSVCQEIFENSEKITRSNRSLNWHWFGRVILGQAGGLWFQRLSYTNRMKKITSISLVTADLSQWGALASCAIDRQWSTAGDGGSINCAPVVPSKVPRDSGFSV
jgi:hypothetical protein